MISGNGWSAPRTLPILVAGGLLLAAGTGRTAPAGPQYPVSRIRLHILFHTDLFGRFRAPGCSKRTASVPHFGRLIGAVQALRTQIRQKGDPPPIVLSTGNLLGPDIMGEFLATRARWRRAAAELLRQVGYDAILIARYDLAAGDNLGRFLAEARDLPFLEGNLSCTWKQDPRCRWTRDRTRPYLLVERGPLKIALVAVQAEDLLAFLVPRDQGLRLVDPLEHVRKAIRAARKEAQLVILFSDLDGPHTSPRRLLKLLRDLGSDGPDLVLANSLYDPAVGRRFVSAIRRSDGRIVLSSGRFPEHLGHLVVEVTPNGGKDRPRVVSADVLDIRRTPAPSAAVRLLDGLTRAMCRIVDRTLGKARFARPHDRREFIVYTLAVLARRLHSELAVLPDSLFAEGGFPLAGPVTVEQIHRAIRFDHPVVRLWVKGSWLKTFLKRHLGQSEPRLWVYGFQKKGRLFYVNGRLLEPTQHYLVATVLPVALGAEGLLPRARVFRKDPKGRTIRRILAEFFEKALYRRAGAKLVDLRTNFVPLHRRFLLTGSTDVTLTVNDVSILRPGLYQDQPQLNRERIAGLRVDATLKGRAQNATHDLQATLSLKYGKTKTWSRSELTGLDETTVSETDDLVTLDLLYRFRKLHERYDPKRWYYPIPFLEWYLETELTSDLVAGDGQTYRYMETAGMLGLSFFLYPKLYLKIGGVSRSHNILVPDERTGEYGLYLGLSLDRYPLVFKRRYRLYLETKLDCYFVQPAAARILEILWTTKAAFSIVDNIFLTVSHELYFYDTADAPFNLASNLAAGLQVLFDVRHQTY